MSREVKCLGQPQTSLPRTSRKVRQVISYAGIIEVAFLSYVTSNSVTASHLYGIDNAFISIFGPTQDSLLSTSSTRSYATINYTSSDDTYEDIHPCLFMAKIQANQVDTPVYGDILKRPAEEFKM